MIAEHRLYWLKEICDRVVYLEHGRIMFDITMQEFLKFSEQKLQKFGLAQCSHIVMKAVKDMSILPKSRT